MSEERLRGVRGALPDLTLGLASDGNDDLIGLKIDPDVEPTLTMYQSFIAWWHMRNGMADGFITPEMYEVWKASFAG